MKATFPIALMLIFGVLFVSSCRISGYGGPYTARYYAQCDPQWQNVVMATQTICATGTVLTCLAMMMTTQDPQVTPASLDTFMDNNAGYFGDTVFWDAIQDYPTTDFTFLTSSIPFSLFTLKQQLDDGYFVILNVNTGSHWVFLFEYDGDGSQYGDFILHDPGAPGADQRLSLAYDPTQMSTYRSNR
jgi:hypothetical protein